MILASRVMPPDFKFEILRAAWNQSSGGGGRDMASEANGGELKMRVAGREWQTRPSLTALPPRQPPVTHWMSTACVLTLLVTLALCVCGCGTNDGASASFSASSTAQEPVTSEVQIDQADSVAAAGVVRSFFTTADPKTMRDLMAQSTEGADSSAPDTQLPQPVEASDLEVTGPLPGVPLHDPMRTDWPERQLFGVTYVLESTTSQGESPGPQELCVVVARRDPQSPWKILRINPGPVPQELPTAERDRLDKLSLSDVVRTYVECCDFDTQIYLSAARHQEDLVEALRDPAQPADITDLSIGTPHAGSSDVYAKEDWPIQMELGVTYQLLVAMDYAPGMPNPSPPGEQTLFIIAGQHDEHGPWKILEVGTGP
jgi:hypothetical protein